METVTEFVIDLSGSMKDKIAMTKHMLLSDIIPTLDYSSKIGIKSFSAVKDTEPIIQELPLSIVDKDAITKAVTALTVKQGGTPISEAIRRSVMTLKEYAASEKKIILVTDGQEDKGGDYVTECKKARSEGINCEIHVVGIGLNAVAETKAKEISKLTNGTYTNIIFAPGTQYNQSAVKHNLSSFYAATAKKSAITPIISVQPTSPIPKQVEAKPVVQETKPTIVADSSKSEEAKLIIEEDLTTETNSILKSLIKEIKEIRDEIKSLKNEKETIPDIVEDAELNENIRSISEKYLFELLKAKYPNRVKWLNENGESNLNHDFEVLVDVGSVDVEYYIECKGTAKQKATFYMTKSEWKLFLNNTRNYQIYFVQNSMSQPTHIFISNVLDWILRGKLLPYLKTRDIIKEERVFLTIDDSHFVS